MCVCVYMPTIVKSVTYRLIHCSTKRPVSELIHKFAHYAKSVIGLREFSHRLGGLRDHRETLNHAKKIFL